MFRSVIGRDYGTFELYFDAFDSGVVTFSFFHIDILESPMILKKKKPFVGLGGLILQADSV